VTAGLGAVEALAAVFGAAGAFLAAGAFFSTGAFEPAATAVGGVATFRVAFGFAAGSAGVDPFDGVVDAVGVVASASLFAEAPLRGRLFDVIACCHLEPDRFCANPGTPGRAPAGRRMSVVGRAR
jgi:hypothetical protein